MKILDFFFIFFICQISSNLISSSYDEIAPQVKLRVSINGLSKVLIQTPRIKLHQIISSCISLDDPEICQKISDIDFGKRPVYLQNLLISKDMIQRAIHKENPQLDLKINLNKKNMIDIFGQKTKRLSFQVQSVLQKQLQKKKNNIKIIKVEPDFIEGLGSDDECLILPDLNNSSWNDDNQIKIYLDPCDGWQDRWFITLEKEVPFIVKNGDQVSLSYELPSGLQIISSGKALSSGKKNQEIPVQIFFSKKEVLAKVKGPGKVEIKRELSF